MADCAGSLLSASADCVLLHKCEIKGFPPAAMEVCANVLQ